MGFVGTTETEVIAEAAAFGAEFPEDLANHLPMVLHAMAELGATPGRLRAFAETYTRRNDVPAAGRPVAPVDAATWTDALGDRARETDLRCFFTAQVARDGVAAVLTSALPHLTDGVAASATHGLMRLAYALLRSDDAEVGAALGYWAATYLPLPERPVGHPALTIPELLGAMRRSPDFLALVPRDMLLWHWIREVAAMPAYAALIGGNHPDRLDLADLRAAGVLLYAGTRSFEALHVVTGAHWLRVVAPWCPDAPTLNARFLDVVLALYPKIGMPALPSEAEIAALRDAPAPDWETLAQAAVASDDEHDHSLVFSAREEERFTGDPVYRRLAAIRLGLL